MKKMGLLSAVVLLLFASAVIGCSSGSPVGTPTGPNVFLANNMFTPSTLTVAVGTTVTWTNKDSVTHTVPSDTGIFNSGGMDKNASFNFTFKTSGTFKYTCTIHPFMTGTVIVQ
jgi:plastocyanin